MHIAPGDAVCQLADVDRRADDDVVYPLHDIRVLCSTVLKGSGGLMTYCCYTLRLDTHAGTLQQQWFEPWYTRSECFILVGHDA